MKDMLLDLPDSLYVNHAFSPDDETLRITLSLWTAEKACIVFRETIAFCVFSIYDCVGMRAGRQDTEFFQTALARFFDPPPAEHGFQCYEILDLDDEPGILVVAKGYEFIKPGYH